MLRDMVETIERQAMELGRLRAITEAAETVSEQERQHAARLEAEIVTLRAELAELRDTAPTKRRWWQR